MKINLIDKIENSLKNPEIDKEKKIILKIMLWALEHKDETDYDKVYNKACYYYNQHNSYFRDYYRNNEHQRKKNLKRAKDLISTKERLEYCKKYLNEARTIYRLYRDGRLSSESTKTITRNLHGIKSKRR